MSREAEMMGAIIAAPDEDAPRLVYGDWLIAQGDPRGSFIVDQCRLARTPETDRGWSRLCARTERQRTTFGAEWASPLAQFFPSREVWQATERRYRRGFVEHVESPLPPVSWDFLEGLAEVTPLRSIAWRPPGERPDQLRRALTSANAAGLDGVTLLSSGALGPSVFDALTPDQMQSLRAFGVRSATVSVSAMARLGRLLPRSLTTLVLDHTRMGDAGIRALARSGLLGHVDRIDLRGNGLGPDGIDAVVAKPSDRPVDLTLADNPEVRTALPALLGWRPLRRLDLVGSIDRTSVDVMLGSPHLASLHKLALAPLRPWHVDEARARALAKIPFTALTRLSLGRCRLGATGMTALATSAHLRHLVVFEAYDSQIGDDGVAALVASPVLARLVTLDLNGNQLTDRSLADLAAWGGLSDLAHLSLGQNYDITEAGWRALMGADQFRPARLGVTQHLRQANPRLWRALEDRFGHGVVHHDGLRWPIPYPSPYATPD